MPLSSPKVIYLKDYRVSDFLIDHVDLVFELGEQSTLVKSKLNIRANPLVEPKQKRLVLQGEELELRSVSLNGKLLDKNDYQLTENELIIDNVTDPCVVEIFNLINPEKNTELSGLYISNNKFTTQCEAEGFRRITYFLDRPDVMATYTTTIIADETKCPVMLSNGNRVVSGKTVDGRSFITWNDPFKKPSYLFALVAGDFDYVEDKYITLSGRTIALQFYAEKGTGDRCRHAIESLKKAMHWDEITYGRECDLDTYKVVSIADFNMGAMENKGLNIFNAKLILASTATVTDERFIAIENTTAHEYFHNWTGNRITIRDLFQLTTKEGLTTFRNQSYMQDTCTKATRAGDVKTLRAYQFPEDAGPLAHPIQPKSYIDPDNFYTPTVYDKGAEVFRMLETLLGVATFRKCMSLYFTRHDGQAITIEQFIAAMQDGSGIDLSQFMLWFHQAGTPEIDVSEQYIPEEQVYILTLKQSCKPTPGQPDKSPLVIPVRMGLIGVDGKPMPFYLKDKPDAQLEEVLLLTEPQQEFVFTKVTSKPVLSLFRNFSAPVKVHHDIPESDYQLRVKYDVDAFNRLEASQCYMMSQLKQIIKQTQEKCTLVLSDQFIDTIGSILNSDMEDLWLLAEMLTVPTESYIADTMDKIDIESIYVAREFLIQESARRLKDSFLATYHKYNAPTSTADTVFDIKEAGIRRIKNECLSYLLSLNLPEIQEIAMKQFCHELPLNMTNIIPIMFGLNQLSTTDRNFVLSQSLALWQEDSLVMDYWFSAQAYAATNADAIKTLMLHPKFDIKQPNKVYAVLRAFCSNMLAFHDLSGRGYQFLAETILQIDKFNPKIASEGVLSLSNWQRFDPARQELMSAALKSILQQPISKSLFEIVSKSLGIVDLKNTDKAAVSEVSARFFTPKTQPQTDSSLSQKDTEVMTAVQP